jgi:hypothetical protein
MCIIIKQYTLFFVYLFENTVLKYILQQAGVNHEVSQIERIHWGLGEIPPSPNYIALQPRAQRRLQINR